MSEQPASPHDIADTLRTWAIETALPLWANAGFDRARGGFHEQLRRDGTPDLTAPKRLRVQARQIYVYSHAAVLGWYPGLHLAFDALVFMRARYRAPDGAPGFAHLITPDGAVANPLRDSYDHAFVLLALAWLFHASGDAQVRLLIDEVLAFIDEHLTAPDGSYFEGIPKTLPRRQNPHMHAFEAMLALHERAGHPDAMARARALHALFETRFIDGETGLLREYFTDAWTPAPGQEGDIVEPGHHAEWTWLLRQYERLNRLPHGARASTLIDSAVRWADPPTGFLIDEAYRNGAARRTTRRTWPQTELAKGWLAEAEAGRAGAADNARRALTALSRHYLDKPIRGGFIDQFDSAGRVVNDVQMASTLYHVFLAVAEADRVLGRRA